ncbi:MAG: hypothetical protein ACFNOO_04765 [Segatella oulorum]
MTQLKLHNLAGEVLDDGLKREKVAGRGSPTDKNEEGCVVEGFDGGW